MAPSNGTGTGTPRFSRRHWGRELIDTTKSVWRDLTGMFRGASGKFSQFRIVVSVFAFRFQEHWPNTWDAYSVLALTVILAALPFDILLAKVPVSEALGAVRAIAAAIGSKASEAYSRYRSRAVSYETYGYDPLAAPDPPTPASDGALG